MVNGVNFGAISTDPTIKLQDTTVAQPSGNAIPQPAPAAAAEVKEDSFEKKGGGAKKAIGFIAVVGAALAGIAFAAKKGKIGELIGKLPEKVQFLKPVLEGIETVGNKVAEYATLGFNKIKALLPKAQEVVEETTEEAAG